MALILESGQIAREQDIGKTSDVPEQSAIAAVDGGVEHLRSAVTELLKRSSVDMVNRSISKYLVAAGSAHDAGDVMNDVAGGQWVIKNAAKKLGGSGYITKAQAITEVEAQTFRIALQIFTAPVTSTMVDDAAAVSPNLADEQYFEDEILLDPLQARGDGSYSVATPSTPGNVPLAFTCEPDSRDLFVKPIAVEATTFTAGEKLTFKFKIERFETG